MEIVLQAVHENVSLIYTYKKKFECLWVMKLWNIVIMDMYNWSNNPKTVHSLTRGLMIWIEYLMVHYYNQRELYT